MATDWGRFVNSANAQAPSPATLTGPANVTELTYHLLNRGYFPYEEINPRVPITRGMLDLKCMQAKEFIQQWKAEGKAGTPMQGSTLYVIQQTAALKRVATHTHLVLRQSTQKEAMDVWIALVGTNGSKLYDVAMLVGWHNAPLEEVLKLNGASSGIMLNNVKASAVHDMLQNSSSPTTNVPMSAPIARARPLQAPDQREREHRAHEDVPSIPAGSRHPYRPASTRDDDDGMQVEPYLQSPSWRRRLCDLDEDLEDDLGMQTATKPKPYVGHVDNNVHRHQPTREDEQYLVSAARRRFVVNFNKDGKDALDTQGCFNKDTLEDLEMQDEPALPSSAGRSRLTRSNVNIGDDRAKQGSALSLSLQDHKMSTIHMQPFVPHALILNMHMTTLTLSCPNSWYHLYRIMPTCCLVLVGASSPISTTARKRSLTRRMSCLSNPCWPPNLAKSNYNIEADHEMARYGHTSTHTYPIGPISITTNPTTQVCCILHPVQDPAPQPPPRRRLQRNDHASASRAPQQNAIVLDSDSDS
ncbi:hypothetical protein V8C86DRAFT_3035898, partial [Haematococcus lacustris]